MSKRERIGLLPKIRIDSSPWFLNASSYASITAESIPSKLAFFGLDLARFVLERFSFLTYIEEIKISYELARTDYRTSLKIICRLVLNFTVYRDMSLMKEAEGCVIIDWHLIARESDIPEDIILPELYTSLHTSVRRVLDQLTTVSTGVQHIVDRIRKE